jgi:hypothetical protein
MPTQTTTGTLTRPALSQAPVSPVDVPASRSLNSDGPRQISIGGQGVPSDGETIPFKPPRRQATIGHTL